MISDCLIVGAGPYGLSLAAHMRKAGTDFRIVGDPMAPWRTSMLSDMHLKSEGFAWPCLSRHRRLRLPLSAPSRAFLTLTLDYR